MIINDAAKEFGLNDILDEVSEFLLIGPYPEIEIPIKYAFSVWYYV